MANVRRQESQRVDYVAQKNFLSATTSHFTGGLWILELPPRPGKNAQRPSTQDWGPALTSQKPMMHEHWLSYVSMIRWPYNILVLPSLYCNILQYYVIPWQYYQQTITFFSILCAILCAFITPCKVLRFENDCSGKKTICSGKKTICSGKKTICSGKKTIFNHFLAWINRFLAWTNRFLSGANRFLSGTIVFKP